MTADLARRAWRSALFPHALLGILALAAFHAQSTYRIPNLLGVLALPVLHIHTADSGVDGLPRSLPIMKTYDRMQAAFPGETFSADIVLEGRNLNEAQVRDAAQRMREIARESDQFQEPVTVDVSRDGQLAVVEVPLAGNGSDGWT